MPPPLRETLVTSTQERVVVFPLMVPIATLDKSGFISGGHSAIFASYSYSNGKIAGIWVWDQNYYPSAKGVIEPSYLSNPRLKK